MGDMNFKHLSEAARIAKCSLLHHSPGAWADKAMSAKVMCSTAGNGLPSHKLCGISEAGNGWLGSLID